MARFFQTGARLACVPVIVLALSLAALDLRAQNEAPLKVEPPAAAPSAADQPAKDPLETLVPKDGFEIPADQRERLAKLLPNAFAKLDRREQPMHIVALGDSVTSYASYDKHEETTHRSYVRLFASELAKLFFYTGSVRDFYPVRGQPDNAERAEGPAITIENMGIGGRLSLHALGRVTTDAFLNKPSLMTISYGINDSYGSINLATYLRVFEQSTKLARAAGCDVAFFGPTTLLDDGSSLAELSRTQQYSSALESLAARLGVFYFDLGSVTASAPGVPAELDDTEALAAYNLHRANAYHFHHAGSVDHKHPSEQAQRLMGLAAYKALLDDPVRRYRAGGIATLDGAGGFELGFKLKNLTDKATAGRVFPMPFGGFVPEVTSVAFALNAGKGKPLTIRYKSATGDSVYKLDGAEPVLRVPLLIADAEQTGSATVSGQVFPFTPIWKLGATDELRTTAGGEFTVIAGEPASAGDYAVNWAGESSNGSFRAGSATGFSFPLPADGSDRHRGPLTLDLRSGGKSYKFARGFEVSRNFGLGTEIPMLRADRYDIPKEASNGSSRDVTVRVSADPSGIRIVHNIGVPMRNLGGKAPFHAEIQIDARSYGKRRSFGFNDFIRIIPLDDGTFKLSSLRQGLFGNGYGRPLDRTEIKVTRQPLTGVGEQLTVTIPRGFFHLHEWALGNANSLLGINTKLFLQSSSASIDNIYPRDGSYSLVWSGISRYNSESLTVLELTDRPTSRWSSRLW